MGAFVVEVSVENCFVDLVDATLLGFGGNIRSIATHENILLAPETITSRICGNVDRE
jgi:hypothetical protein